MKKNKSLEYRYINMCFYKSKCKIFVFEDTTIYTAFFNFSIRNGYDVSRDYKEIFLQYDKNLKEKED